MELGHHAADAVKTDPRNVYRKVHKEVKIAYVPVPGHCWGSSIQSNDSASRSQ